jgi:mono/diheme cytochrome c family protein
LRIVSVLAGVLLAGLLAFLWLAWYPAIARISVPSPNSFPQNIVAQGAMLAGAGDCAVCHTAAGGKSYAGGYGVATPFGTIFTPNITPDAQTGIGNWSEAAFDRAMHQGISRDGTQLFPAFPYGHFTKITGPDLHALYAYLMSQPPITATPPRNTVPFPFNIRLLQAGWKILFFRAGVYQPDPLQSAAWNRGAYLATGLGHCGGCHTPRNVAGAEEASQTYHGAVIDGWTAPALTATSPSPLPWTQADIFNYLRTGASARHGAALGPMSAVVHTGLAHLPESDITALAVYFAAQNGSATAAATAPPAPSETAGQQLVDTDAHLYANACASCHYGGAQPPRANRPDLALATDLSLPDPSNFILTVLHGAGTQDTISGAMMPGFAAAMSDEDIAHLADYLRRTRTNLPPWPDLAHKVGALRAKASQS